MSVQSKTATVPPPQGVSHPSSRSGDGRAKRSESTATDALGGRTAKGLSYVPKVAAEFIEPSNSLNLKSFALRNHHFPSPEMLGSAASLVDGVEESLEIGVRTSYLEIGPGIISLRSSDLGAIAQREADKEAEAAYELVAARLRAEALEDLASDQLPLGLPLEAQEPDETEEPPAPKRGAITEWSAKSRSNMVRTLAKIDYEPLFNQGIPAMVTFTYPGDWVTVAPDGAAVKRHFKMWQKRFQRAWGRQLKFVAKLEFQRRGAPHLHVFMVPPDWKIKRTKNSQEPDMDFRKWLSLSWADVVAHPDPEERRKHELAGTGIDFNQGMTAKDPKRLAIYFSKHSAAGRGDKEYQHIVPKEWQGTIEYSEIPKTGNDAPKALLDRFKNPEKQEKITVISETPAAKVGRFWWTGGLEKTTVEVAIAETDYLEARRFVRRSSRKTTISSQVPDAKYPAHVVPTMRTVIREHGGKMRRQRRRAERIDQGINQYTESVPGGYLTVNDGASYASQLARALAIKKAEIRDPLAVDLETRLLHFRATGQVLKSVSSSNALSVF